MKIFRLSQEVNRGYDTYDSVIVCADSEEDAKTIHPNGYEFNKHLYPNSNPWCNEIESVKVEYIGEAKEGLPRGVVLASFNAG